MMACMASPSKDPAAHLVELRTSFERRGVGGLQALVDKLAPSDAWMDALIDSVADEGTSVPATWMLRAYLERGVELERSQTAALLRCVNRIADDDARLHVCQSVARLEVPARNAEQLARFLREGCRGEHKFTRAWATDAFHRLALQHKRYRVEAHEWLQRAHRDAAASVRARARNIAKELGR